MCRLLATNSEVTCKTLLGLSRLWSILNLYLLMKHIRVSWVSLLVKQHHSILDIFLIFILWNVLSWTTDYAYLLSLRLCDDSHAFSRDCFGYADNVHEWKIAVHINILHQNMHLCSTVLLLGILEAVGWSLLLIRLKVNWNLAKYPWFLQQGNVEFRQW